MAGAEEIRDIEHDSSFSRDLLQRFVCGNLFPIKSADGTALPNEEESMELNLGLSLNGSFGVDPERANKLIRASSVSNFMSIGAEETTACLAPFSTYAPLTRTCSLPAETEEEWRRKELQCLRRLEAKRKRIEKLKNVRVIKGKIELEQNSEDNGLASAVLINGNCLGFELKGEKGECLGGGGRFEGLKPPQFLPQGSIGSQGSGSAVIYDFEIQPIRGTNKNTEVRSTASVQLPQQQIEQKPAANPRPINDKPSNVARPVLGNPAEKVIVAEREANEMVRNMMADMPCVSTKGDGPNGRRIEGFLYRYRKGEEVRIVCVCHGIFLSPAEFVKHGGGGDVTHPLRHIVVDPHSFL